MFKNNRGSAYIVFLFFLLVAMPLLSIVTDVAFAQAIKVKARHDLNLACRAASNQIDIEALSDAENPRTIILPADAWAAYNQILQQNMFLDSSNNPLDGSISDGNVQTLNFTVVNTPDLPYLFSFQDFNETINRPSVTATITFPVKASALLRFTTGLDHFDLCVHSTVGPELKKQP